jgi:hypothetical protein
MNTDVNFFHIWYLSFCVEILDIVENWIKPYCGKLFKVCQNGLLTNKYKGIIK